MIINTNNHSISQHEKHLIHTHIHTTGDDEHKRPTRMQPLNSEMILSKEQLFDMFQQILGVKKFEHQILFNALMVRKMFFHTPNEITSIKS